MSDLLLLPNLEILYSRSKNTSYRKMMLASHIAILSYLIKNQLLLINPFEADGTPIANLDILRSHVTTEGYKLFQKPIDSWLQARAKDSDYANVQALDKWLLKIKNGECNGGKWKD